MAQQYTKLALPNQWDTHVTSDVVDIQKKHGTHENIHWGVMHRERTGSNPDLHGFPGGSVVKNLPAMQETWVQFLGWEHPLEEELATHSSILAWEVA